MGLACARKARLLPLLRALFFGAIIVAGDGAFARFEPDPVAGRDGAPPTSAGTESTAGSWEAKAFTSATPAVSSHTDFTLALSKDGKVFAWGWDTRGQLGRGRKLFSAVPVKITELPALVHMDAGPVHVAAADAAGNVWTWGQDTLGQLGPRASGEWTRPGRVTGVGSVRRVVAAFSFTAALRLDGTVSVWGSFAQQGGAPRTVSGLAGISEIRGGTGHLVALKNDGTVWTVGDNSAGQLGDGTAGNTRASGFQVPGLANIVKIAAGACSSLALRNDGTVFAWGEAACGYPSTPRYSPQAVSGLAGVADISGGFHYSHAILADGTVRYWDNSYAPSTRSGFSNVAYLFAESVLESIVLSKTATVHVYGQNELGQHGLGNTLPAPGVTTVPGLSGISFVSSSVSGNGGLSHFALTAGGDLYGWGSNFEGQLAQGDSMLSSVPVQVAGLPPIVKIAAGDLSAYALDSNGIVWAWGDNLALQLGDGTNTPRSVPVQVSGISGVMDVAAGRRFVVFAKTDGTVWIIGTPFGLGSSAVPQQVATLAGITSVAARYSNAYAIRSSDGKVFAWGRGLNGMIGDGSTADRATPVMLTAFNSAVTMVSVGQFHALARTADGGVWSWGSDFGVGSLGDGISGSHSRLSPARVTGVAVSDAVAAGYTHSLAKLSNGMVFSWGTSALGNGAMESRNVPGPVSRLTTARTIAAGDYSSFAVDIDGSAFAWGGGVNRTTQISTFGASTGDGTFVYRQLPVLVIRDGARAASTVSGLPCILTGLYLGGPSSSLQGSSASFTATLVGLSPTGSVQFKDGAAGLGAPLALAAGNEAVASATLSTNALAIGTHSIGAEYSGDAQNPPNATSTALLHTVTPAATGTSVALSGAGEFLRGQSVALSASVTGNNPTGTVQFKDGGVNLGSPATLFGSTATLSVDHARARRAHDHGGLQRRQPERAGRTWVRRRTHSCIRCTPRFPRSCSSPRA